MLILVFALFSVDIREQIGKKGIEIKEICCKQTSKRKESVNVIFAC